MSEEDSTWKGFSIEDIFEGFSTFERRKAPIVEDSENSTVLFQLPLSDDENEFPVPKSSECSDKWDEKHVRLPCSPESIYFEQVDGVKITKKRWDLIKSSLKDQKISDSVQLENCILKYNSKFEFAWQFNGVHKLFDDEFSEEDGLYFFDEVLVRIIDLALELPNLIKTPIPLLFQKSNHSISLSKQQASCLLANGFLCTFPKRNILRKNTDFPDINFSRLFSSTNNVQKIKCICNYFRRILLVSIPRGVLTFQRRYIKPEDFPDWSKSELKFSTIKWHATSTGTIENADGCAQIDFANRYLGGGVLGHGCVQEEIRFVISCELILGMLFCESMKPEEAILIYGAEQFNKYTGYASSFNWDGNFNDPIPCDEFRRKLVHVIAIDALSFHKPWQQFEEFLLKREVNKAFTGFYHDPQDQVVGIPIASGNWGCGCFRGDKNLKSLLQLIACTANKRNLIYFTFGDETLVRDISEMYTFLQNNDITIGQLWKYLTSFKGQKRKFDELFQFIYDQYEVQHLVDGLENESDTFRQTEELKMDDDEGNSTNVELKMNEESKTTNEKRRSKSDDEVSSSKIENNSNEILENPSKRTKIYDENENSNISDLCENLKQKISEIKSINGKEEIKAEETNE